MYYDIGSIPHIHVTKRQYNLEMCNTVMDREQIPIMPNYVVYNTKS